MKINLTFFLFFMLSFFVETVQAQSESNGYYQKAISCLNEKNTTNALKYLEKAIEINALSPMSIIRDTHFYPLIDIAALRMETRKLIRENACVETVTMVRPNEPGVPISISGIIIDEASKKPLANVLVELIHTDSLGKYFHEEGRWNPRLFCYVKTDEKGRFEVHTILPAGYSNDSGTFEDPHIHFTLEFEGYRSYNSEFLLGHLSKTDSRLVAKPSLENPHHYSITIGMQKKRQ